MLTYAQYAAVFAPSQALKSLLLYNFCEKGAVATFLLDSPLPLVRLFRTKYRGRFSPRACRQLPAEHPLHTTLRRTPRSRSCILPP